ncbi:carbohydrate-binding protein [Fibrobacter sp. UBA4297]|uniref:carbohydrate-binding protein n=2 Tax=Fibrobacter TaxID=832 RepID=UPI0025BDCFB6|nr:carbohydrate-binding protein [Fibrobacter sp. UBA4297]
MKLLKKATMFGLLAGFGVSALADNPISTYHYLADPGAAADDDYFYIITDSDDPAPYNSNGYKIYALYAFRSRDMQNWTDFGIIYDARKVSGINDIWASGIAVHNGTFYIVFPDGGGGGIGYIKAPAIEGPWTNAVGQGKDKLVGGRGIIGCDGVSWCFDPGIFIDDDGTTYVTWGGGESNSRPNTDNFDIVKLNDAKNAPVGNGSHVKVNNLPTRKMLEASYIHKHKGTYYFSYSTGWQQGAPTIDYGTSNNVMGPYTWKGTILGDPSMNGRSINGNNNHHGIAEFKGHSYVVYHDRRIAKGHNGLEIIPADDGKAKPNEGYHRSVSVDEMFYNADGTIQTVKVTDEGPAQIENFDPYDWYPALTSSKQKGIRSRSNFVQGKAADHVMLPLSSKEAWLRVSGVDFGAGATGFTVEAASTTDGNKVEIRSGSATGTLAGTCTIKNTGNKNTYAENKCEVEGLKGIVKQLFLVFKGNQDSTMAVKAWGFEGSGTTPPEPQKPFSGKAWEIPGKIEMEDFDIPGSGRGSEIKSYSENDSEDHGAESNGGKSYREDTGVDIYKKATGYVVGYNQSGEWLEYTVNVKEDGDYTMFASVATDNSTASFTLAIDDKSIAEVPVSGDSWDDFVKVKANVKLTAGEHVLRFTVTGDWFDIDYMQFAAGKNATDPDDETIGIKGFRVLGADAVANFDVFDLNGKKITSFTARHIHEAKKLWRDNAMSKSVQGVCIIRNRNNGAVARVRTTR